MTFVSKDLEVVKFMFHIPNQKQKHGQQQQRSMPFLPKSLKFGRIFQKPLWCEHNKIPPQNIWSGQPILCAPWKKPNHQKKEQTFRCEQNICNTIWAEITGQRREQIRTRYSVYRCFRKWWYPQNTSKWSFLVGKPMGLLGKPTILGNPHIHS